MPTEKRAFRCYNPACASETFGGFNYWNETGRCPKCNAGPPIAIPLARIHLLIPAVDGPIHGAGQRFKIACDPKRSHLALALGGRITEEYHATGEIGAASCPECLMAAGVPSILMSPESRAFFDKE